MHRPPSAIFLFCSLAWSAIAVAEAWLGRDTTAWVSLLTAGVWALILILTAPSPPQS